MIALIGASHSHTHIILIWSVMDIGSVAAGSEAMIE